MLIGYARVSTQDQNLDLQIDALTKAGVDRVFTDKASGVRDDRPGLREALSYTREGDCLIVWKLDRLGRSMKSMVVLAEELRERGVDFRSLTDSIDTSTPAGRCFFGVMASFAQMEKDLNRERTMAGLSAARARGSHCGRKPSLSDKQIAHARVLLADPKTTIKDVAISLGVSRPTIYRSLGLGNFANATVG